MKLSKATRLELKTILKQEFDLELQDKELERLSYSLVNYFSLLLKIENRHKFGNRPSPAIDQGNDKNLDKEETK